MKNKSNVNQIPKIQQTPKLANDTAIHYGYVAFKDINLGGPMGLEHHVQPDQSPYYRELPCRELLPFTNILYTAIDEQAAASTSYVRQAAPIYTEQKTARECVEEMAASYEPWGFEVLAELTGYDEDEAFHIFQTIQPFTYRLKDLLREVEYAAVDRIDAVMPYVVAYENESFTLEPLPPHLKAVARAVQQRIIRSVEVATNMGLDMKDKTTQSMTQYFATGSGKRRPDPLDQYLFNEFGEEPPTLLNAKEPESGTGVLEKLADLLGGKKDDKVEKELAEIRALKEQLQEKIAAPKAVTIGQQVTVGGQEAVVTAKPFGKIKVTFNDGSVKTVEKSEIE